MSSRFGRIFQITSFGESHGGGVGVVVDGCPPRLPLQAAEIQRDLDRRRPGQSHLTTPRQEADRVEILSGVFEGHTLGSPIALLVRNLEQRGLLRRAKSKRDQRAKIVTISAAGKKLLQAALPAVESAQQRILAPLSDVESGQLLKLLDKLAENNNALSRAPARPKRRSA